MGTRGGNVFDRSGRLLLKLSSAIASYQSEC